jgi:hypothetical protein
MLVSVPPASDPVWRKIICGRIKYEFEFIAAKIFLGHLMVRIQYSSSEDVIAKGAKDLREIFVKSINLPSVQRDLKKISG